MLSSNILLEKYISSEFVSALSSHRSIQLCSLLYAISSHNALITLCSNHLELCQLPHIVQYYINDSFESHYNSSSLFYTNGEQTITSIPINDTFRV